LDTRKQATARQCLEGAESGTMTFPQIVGTLMMAIDAERNYES